MTVEQQVNASNQQVLDILLNARPVWADVQPALQAIEGDLGAGQGRALGHDDRTDREGVADKLHTELGEE